MAIFGLGTDIVEVSRIKLDKDQVATKFSERLLTQDERQELANNHFPQQFLAKRWAAKEACAKAFGTGIAKGLSFQDMEVCHDQLGKPYFKFSGTTQNFISEQGIIQAHLSISDEKNYAVATVILEK